MSLDLDDILAQLDQEKTAEEQMESELTSETSDVSEEKVAKKQEAETEEVEASEKEASREEAKSSETAKEAQKSETTEDVEKVADDLEVRGRIMARGFYDELQKLANDESQETEKETGEKTASAKSQGFADEVVSSLLNKYK